MKRASRLTPEQEHPVRAFINDVEVLGLPISNKIIIELLDLLGYKVAPNGARVWKEIEIKIPYGGKCELEDQFMSDWNDIGMTFDDVEIEHEAEDQPESSTSEPPEGSEVR